MIVQERQFDGQNKYRVATQNCDYSNFTGSSEAQIRHIISELQLDKKIKALEHNLNSFTRVAGVGGVEETVTVVKQIPR